MDILEEIRNTIKEYDPELFKNEEDEEDKNISIDNYQEVIDSTVDPEDLNFSMDNLFDDPEDEDEEEIETIPIPQKDNNEEPLEVGARVQKLTQKERAGSVLAIGELVEVEWDAGFITLEYPEELIRIEDAEESEDELTSLDTDPPIAIENPSK